MRPAIPMPKNKEMNEGKVRVTTLHKGKKSSFRSTFDYATEYVRNAMQRGYKIIIRIL